MFVIKLLVKKDWQSESKQNTVRSYISSALTVGLLVGLRVGFLVGLRVGFLVGLRVGVTGFLVGLLVGFLVGLRVGDAPFPLPFPS